MEDDECDPRLEEEDDEDKLRLEDEEVRPDEDEERPDDEDEDAENDARDCQLPEATLDAGDGPGKLPFALLSLVPTSRLRPLVCVFKVVQWGQGPPPGRSDGARPSLPGLTPRPS